MKIVCGIYFIFKTNARSKTFSEPRRARTRLETTSVFVLYYIYRFENIIHISFCNKKTQKIVYIEPTLVLTQHGRQHVDTPTTLLELSSPIQPRWSENEVSPYATFIIGRP